MSKGKIVLAGLILIAAACLIYIGPEKYLNLDFIKSKLDLLANYRQENPITMILLYSGIYIAVTAASIPGALLLTLLGGAIFGFLLGFFDFLVAETGGVLDDDFLLFAGAFVLGGDIEDAVRVDVEGHLDLRGAARLGFDAVEPEIAELLVIGHQLALALADDNVDGGLAVGGGRENNMTSSVARLKNTGSEKGADRLADIQRDPVWKARPSANTE